jgi:two-component system, chemotaxis family, chemotaxis protein CheY
MIRIALVGHCGPDTSYLMMAAKKAVPGAELVRVNSARDLEAFADAGTGLLLVNRVLDGDFDDGSGIDLIARLRAQRAGVRAILISNYEDAQSAAIKAGALPGFGKRDIGSAKANEMIRRGAEAVAAGSAGAGASGAPVDAAMRQDV